MTTRSINNTRTVITTSTDVPSPALGEGQLHTGDLVEVQDAQQLEVVMGDGIAFPRSLVGLIPPGPLASQVVFVRKGGSDTTGTGSFAQPFLTIARALASIIDASVSKRYQIDVGPGEYPDAFQIKPWVAIIGPHSGSNFFDVCEITAPTDSLGFDASWSAAAFGVGWFAGLQFDAHQLWNDTSDAKVQLNFSDVVFQSGVGFLGTGTGGVDNATWLRCLSYGGVEMTGWQFLFTNDVEFLGGTCVIQAAGAGALEATTWLALNTAIGAHTNPTNVQVIYPAGGPQPARADWNNTSLVGTITLSGAQALFTADPVSNVPQSKVVLVGGAPTPDYLRVPASSGLVTLGAAGTAVVPFPITADQRVTITWQDGGTNAVGAPQVKPGSRIVGTSFAIESTNGAADNGVVAYWQVWSPTGTSF